MSEAFDRLVNIVKRLRSPNGCPWDRKQTLYSLRQNVIEEVFEFIDALDRKDIENIKEELGDMLLHIVFHSEIAEEERLFSLDDVINGICDKLIRRHPHVFGNIKVKDVDEVLKNWDELKAKERTEKPKHYLDDVPKGLPPIERAFKLQEKSRKVGFDWKSSDDCFNKVEEEFEELKNAIKEGNKNNIEHEIGDLIFALINYARLNGMDPSKALNLANIRFETRFNCIEDKLEKQHKKLGEIKLDELNKFWEECKKGI